MHIKLAIVMGLQFGVCAVVLSCSVAAQNIATDAASRARPDRVNQKRGGERRNLADLSLEELMTVKVSSASRKPESLSQAPAAIFVLTGDDIRRGGFSNVAEALRMVPGVYVARVNQRWWTVSARGFSDYLNNKMLVLIDGRSVYSPQFGGVYWDIQEVALDDIERIEVIRGPGGTLWGANAINGVINIVTRNSRETQGYSVVTSGGVDEGYLASARYGGQIGTEATYRVYGKGSYWYPGLGSPARKAYDLAKLSQGGLRLDWKISDKDNLMVDGGGYRGAHQNEAMLYASPTSGRSPVQEMAPLWGGHFLGRWTHTVSARSRTEVLGYCDWTDVVSFATEARHTCSVEFQHDYRMGGRHSLIWGGGVLDTRGTPYTSFNMKALPGGQHNNVVSGFGQYEFAVIPERLRLIAGSKFEHNLFTGFEAQPQVRGVWTPSRRHTIWAAVSRAVRTPDQLERTEQFALSQLPSSVPTFLSVIGNPHLKSEALRAYEFGYRLEPAPFLSLDTAIFYNHYDNLINVELINPFGVAGPPIVHHNPLYVEIPVPWQNLGAGQTHGAEIYLRIKPMDRWMLSAGITELRGNSINRNDTLNLPVANTPKHQFNVQSRLNLTSRLELDSGLYHYNGIPGYRFGGLLIQDVPTHNRMDLGVSFRGFNGLIFSVWARDLAANPHWENRPALFTTSGAQMGRSIVVRAAWQPKYMD